MSFVDYHHIAKEISFGGITTITTDYKLMAKKTANYISLKKSYQTIQIQLFMLTQCIIHFYAGP